MLAKCWLNVSLENDFRTSQLQDATRTDELFELFDTSRQTLPGEKPSSHPRTPFIFFWIPSAKLRCQMAVQIAQSSPKNQSSDAAAGFLTLGSLLLWKVLHPQSIPGCWPTPQVAPHTFFLITEYIAEPPPVDLCCGQLIPSRYLGYPAKPCSFGDINNHLQLKINPFSPTSRSTQISPPSGSLLFRLISFL